MDLGSPGLDNVQHGRHGHGCIRCVAALVQNPDGKGDTSGAVSTPASGSKGRQSEREGGREQETRPRQSADS